MRRGRQRESEYNGKLNKERTARMRRMGKRQRER